MKGLEQLVILLALYTHPGWMPNETFQVGTTPRTYVPFTIEVILPTQPAKIS
jgi:hypothetical protein